MKVKFLKGICLIFLFLYSFSYSNISEYDKAFTRLDSNKELYFSIPKNFLNKISDLGNYISIDKIENERIYAYSNKSEFERFISLEVPFIVEKNPGDVDFICSDYSDSKMREEFTKWPTYQGLLTLINQYAKDYPDICKVIEVGKTIKNRSILCVVITAKSNAPYKLKFFQCGPPHGDELTGMMLSFRMLNLLTSKYKEGDARIKNILENLELWIIPLFNLDGTYKGGDNSVSGAQRGNSNGVDLNRTFPTLPGLSPEASQQTETKVLMEFLKNNQFTIGVDFHGGIESYLFPWSCKTARHTDMAWYKSNGDYLNKKTTGGVSSGVGQPQDIVGYLAKGSILDYFAYGGFMKSYSFELSVTKLIQESQFNTYWDKYREMLLCFYEQTFTGIQGQITDSITHNPIEKVKISIESLDKENSWTYSSNDGGYCRLVAKGTYNVAFSHTDYKTKTISSVSVEDFKKSELNVILIPNKVDILKKQTGMLYWEIRKNQKGIEFSFDNIKKNGTLSIYSVKGSLVKSLPFINQESVQWDYKIEKKTNVSDGFYFATLKLSNGSNTNYRFFIQKD